MLKQTSIAYNSTKLEISICKTRNIPFAFCGPKPLEAKNLQFFCREDVKVIFLIDFIDHPVQK